MYSCKDVEIKSSKSTGLAVYEGCSTYESSNAIIPLYKMMPDEEKKLQRFVFIAYDD